MKIDIYLVKDEYSTVANFRYQQKALDFASSNKNFTVERIEIELPSYKDFKKVFKDEYNTLPKDKELVLDNSDNSLETVVNNHLLKIYIENDRNKLRTAKLLGITVKTLYNRFNKIGIV